ncbi:hypothetical protein Tco_1277797, partial [Tanacetum coccineum]
EAFKVLAKNYLFTESHELFVMKKQGSVEDSRNKAEEEAKEASIPNGGPKKADEEGDNMQLLKDANENGVIIS